MSATRWTLPTLHAEMTRRRQAKGDAEPVRNRPMRCEQCRAITPLDMLVDLRPLLPGIRAQLGAAPDREWLCTGCIGTAHNLGDISHAELFTAFGAPPSARAWAEAHTLEYPYRHGSLAHADQHALSDGLPPQLPSAAAIR